MIKKAFIGYLWSFSAYGFYRGWIAEYKYHTYDSSITTVRYSLVTEKYIDRCFRGMVNAAFYGSFGHPFALYRLICRMEIGWTGKNPYEHLAAYNEAFDRITLPPPVTEKKIR